MKPLTGRTLTGARLGFAIAMAAAFAVAISPLALKTGADNGDKIAHILAFYGLTIFAAISFPKTNILIIGLAMSSFGAVIEIVQGFSFIGRDRDLVDWIADTAAVVAALAPLLTARLRII